MRLPPLTPIVRVGLWALLEAMRVTGHILSFEFYSSTNQYLVVRNDFRGFDPTYQSPPYGYHLDMHTATKPFEVPFHKIPTLLDSSEVNRYSWELLVFKYRLETFEGMPLAHK